MEQRREAGERNPWVPLHRARGASAAEGAGGPGRVVYCSPPAGVGARSFLGRIDDPVVRGAMRVVQLPGREDRFGEPPISDLRDIAGAVAAAIMAEEPKEYALFGHSFGGLVMLEAARTLLRDYGSHPVVLAVAGCTPPHLRRSRRWERLDDEALTTMVRDLGGPDFDGPDGKALAEIVFPPLRADLRVYDDYLKDPGGGVNCPILALSGSRDGWATTEKMTSWSDYTDQDFVVRRYEGGHYFAMESSEPLSEALRWLKGSMM